MIVIFYVFVFIFFCKHKTAYEMRISDWSSDVCSSDLFAISVVSEEKSTSSIRERASVRLVDCDVRLVMADDRRFCTAPSFARPSLMVLIAASSLSRALTAFAWVSKLLVADPAVSTGVPASGTPAVAVLTAPSRSEERRVGTEFVSTCISRWSRYH